MTQDSLGRYKSRRKNLKLDDIAVYRISGKPGIQILIRLAQISLYSKSRVF